MKMSLHLHCKYNLEYQHDQHGLKQDFQFIVLTLIQLSHYAKLIIKLP